MNIPSQIRLFADDCILYLEIKDNQDTIELQNDLDQLYCWAETNKMNINTTKSEAITFCRSKNIKNSSYTLGKDEISRVMSCKYLGVYFDSKLSWEKQVSNVAGKAWRSLHFVMRNLKKCNTEAKQLAYTSLVRPVLEYGVSCWDPYRMGHKSSLDRIQNKAAKFVFNGRKKVTQWETLEVRRKKARLCSMFRSYTGCNAWSEIRERFKKPNYYSRKDHGHKIRTNKQNMM